MAVIWAFVFFCRWVISVSYCGCIVVIRRRDYLSLWLMGVISWSFVCSDPQSLWLGSLLSFARCIFESWEPSFVEFQTFLFFVEVLLVLVDLMASLCSLTGVVQYFGILK